MFTDNEEGSPNAARRVQRWELPSAPLSGSDCVLIPKGRKSFRDDLPVVSQSWRAGAAGENGRSFRIVAGKDSE